MLGHHHDIVNHMHVLYAALTVASSLGEHDCVPWQGHAAYLRRQNRGKTRNMNVRQSKGKRGGRTMAIRLYWRARMRAALCMQVSKERVNHSSTHLTCSLHMRIASPCCTPS